LLPLVSVIIPTYNRSGHLAKTVGSVAKQSFVDHQIIIVDDRSSDDTTELVNELKRKDKRIEYFRQPFRSGAQAARNAGIKAARGEWIAFLDSDDEWLPNSLEIRLQLANKEGVKVVHSECLVCRVDENMKLLGVPPMAGWIYPDVLAHPGPMFQALLTTKDALKKIGYLDEDIVSYQEWDTAIRLAKYYQFGFVVAPTFVYDCRDTDTISKDMQRDALGYEQVYRKHALAILQYGGPRILSQHYHNATFRYQRAGDQHAAQRCMLMGFLWWPFRPRAILQRFQQLLLR
jgi:glycosyltransferase involved in cell wall biosynthesis